MCMYATDTLSDDPAILKTLLARERMQRAVEVAARDQQIAQQHAACEQIKQEAANAIDALK